MHPPDPEPIRSISVLMPTWQGGEFLARVLDALAAQRCALPWDFLAIDSGSTDGTWELLEERAPSFPVPLRRERIDKLEFDHGDTRNLLAARSSGDLLVYLTQDAIPVGADWLEKLARNFDDPRIGAAYCRNVPRPDARPSTQLLSAGDPGYARERRVVELPPRELYEALSPHEKRLLYNFNDVASAVRRALWRRHPFPRTWFGEDVLMARALLEAGWRIAYEAEAVVEHSHDYGEQETFERARIDGRFNAEWLDRICIGAKKDADTLVERLAPADRAAARAAASDPKAAEALLAELQGLRRAAFRGLHEGGLAPRRRAASALLEREQLSILYVVHGFPPDTWAGTEIYTLNIASEMQRRGHRVAILARAPGAQAGAGEREFEPVESEFQGLRVLRYVHRLEHKNLRESYSKREPEQMFRALLLRERPDLVHFQHLIHSSAGLVGIARELGLATVVHCHDYWALCARVQMIRPDGQRCAETMGAGCYLCVKEKHLEQVPLARKLGTLAGPLAGPLAEFVAGAVGHEEFAHLMERHEFVPKAYAAADLLISPSRFLRQKLLDSGHFDAHSFLYSDNGMRTDHIRALVKRPDPAGRVRFGFIGTLAWYKGGEVLVRAIARLAGQPVVLRVHGGFAPERDEHHALLARITAETGAPVEFAGPFPNEKLSEVLAEIDVLVVPSIWYENSPIAIHEAWMARTPVLASRLGGMAEFVRDGVDGLLFEAGNEADLADTMLRFVREPGLAARLGSQPMSVKTIAENAQELEFRYRALVCTRRRPSAATLFDAAGLAAARRSGPTDTQGADLLLLRPGGAAAEYDFASGGAGAVELAIDVFALGGESGVELGGRVLLDGREVGRIAPFRAGAADRTQRCEFRAALDPAAGAQHVLRLETALFAGGPEAYLRIARVRVRSCASAAPQGSAASAADGRASSSHAPAPAAPRSPGARA